MPIFIQAKSKKSVRHTNIEEHKVAAHEILYIISGQKFDKIQTSRLRIYLSFREAFSVQYPYLLKIYCNVLQVILLCK